MTVTPTFYRLDGSVVIADPVMVQSAEIRYVEVKQLLPKQYRQERNWGGLTLSYFGFNREMWSQVRFWVLTVETVSTNFSPLSRSRAPIITRQFGGCRKTPNRSSLWAT